MSDQMPKIVTSRLAALEMRPEASHPDADLLTAFLEQVLADGERGAIVSHLAECAPCREIVALAQPLGEEKQTVVAAGRLSGARSFWRWGALAACGVLAVSLVLHKRENRSLTLDQQQNSTVAGAAAAGGKPSPGVRSETGTASVQDSPPAVDSLLAERRVEPLRLEPGAPVDASVARMADSVARNDAGASMGELSAAKSLSAPVLPGRDAAAPSTTGAVSSMEIAQNEVAKKETDTKADQLSKTSSFGRMKAKQEPDAVAVSSQPATPVASSEKDEFRASSSQMANVGAFAAARQASTWQITDAGDLQRSFDGGKNWESISVNRPARLRVVVAIGFHIWAGGNGGLLFHSEDGGSHFALVRVGQSPAALSGDIVTLAFADAQQGRLETSAHEVWITSDGGKTWLSSAPAK